MRLKKNNWQHIETILHNVLKFQFDGARFHKGQVSANVGISCDVVSASPIETR